MKWKIKHVWNHQPDIFSHYQPLLTIINHGFSPSNLWDHQPDNVAWVCPKTSRTPRTLDNTIWSKRNTEETCWLHPSSDVEPWNRCETQDVSFLVPWSTCLWTEEQCKTRWFHKHKTGNRTITTGYMVGNLRECQGNHREPIQLGTEVWNMHGALAGAAINFRSVFYIARSSIPTYGNFSVFTIVSPPFQIFSPCHDVSAFFHHV